MSDKNTGGAAFPHGYTRDNYPSEGMTLRDYFAAKSMHAIYTRFGGSPCAGNNVDGALDYAASGAYAMADAMLRARENT